MRLLWILLIAVLGVGAGYMFTRFEQSAPEIGTRVAPAFVNDDYLHEFRISDVGTGVENVRIWVEHDGQEYELSNETYPGSVFSGATLNLERRTEVSIKPGELGLGDGPATLKARARDWSWSGNTTEVVIDLVIDTRAPRISLGTGLTYVRRGGSEMVAYSVEDDVEKHGVQVGEHFFPGAVHPRDPSRRVALYGVPADHPKDDAPQVIAVDRAGNQSSVGVTIELMDRKFPKDTIRLSTSFMERKAAELLGGTNGSTPLESYLKLNGEMRKDNARTIREVCSKSSPDRIWNGSFLQLPNSNVGARFAEHRTYVFQDRKVDTQTHLGYDLASTSRAPIPSANDGVVQYADNLGIYGKTVIVDHGMGLFTLYGHLSEIGIEKGQVVARGEELGKTGTTGLAGGDHLHYAVIVGGLFVDPLEWFDARWIQDHIEPKLSAGAL